MAKLSLQKNGQKCAISAIEILPMAEFRQFLLAAIPEKNLQILDFTNSVLAGQNCVLAVLGNPYTHEIGVIAGAVAAKQYESLSAVLPQLNYFEREIAEKTNWQIVNLPNPKPVRFLHADAPGVADYAAMAGSGTHEVAVGPIHAGVIEPGHFRFQCLGETVYNLEISLGYQHRGVETQLASATPARRVHLLETVAGDSSVSEMLAYGLVKKALTQNESTDDTLSDFQLLAAELERIANHVGDLGALAGDVAFLPTASFCGRIRGEYLNMTADLCGNRFGRGLVRGDFSPVACSPELAGKILAKLAVVEPQLWNALDLLFDAPTVLERFENTGKLTSEIVQNLGGVGIVARAAQIKNDARQDYPYLSYARQNWQIAVAKTGDVWARARVRYEELKVSHRLIKNILTALSKSTNGIAAQTDTAKNFAPNSMAIGVVEAWRGALTHWCLTDDGGKIVQYRVIDPSFHNWPLLALALREEEISNFPICNKSFNLSYCGHDL